MFYPVRWLRYSHTPLRQTILCSTVSTVSTTTYPSWSVITHNTTSAVFVLVVRVAIARSHSPRFSFVSQAVHPFSPWRKDMLQMHAGMTTPATDDLVLIMNVTPVYGCWHHFCPDVSHFSLAWLPCSPRTTTIMCCARDKSFAFLCKTSLIQFFVMLTLITHVNADEERQKHASPFVISLSRVLDRPSGWESVPRG